MKRFSIQSAAVAAMSAALLTACASLPGLSRPSAATEVGNWMTGVFSSHTQAAAQPDDYFEVRLVMLPIWTERDDGPWLYVEQAVAEALDRPYRQRVYHVVDIPSGARSDVFELPGDPLTFARAWEKADAFTQIEPEDLVPRTGCSIFLTRGMDEVSYVGATRGSGCTSSLRGASYAASEVTVTPNVLSSWDRGFDDNGVQIWGATAGPYVFERIEPLF